MKEFDYVINGGGCAGLSLAYELNINSELSDKTLAIIENRDEYKRDKTWSFWRVSSHNFEDCVKKNWTNFTINIPHHTKHIECKSTPYQTIDSGLFYKKILEAKNIFNQAREKALKDINAKRELLDGQIDEEISKAEQEISTLRESAPDKINTIAIETSCCDTSKS